MALIRCPECRNEVSDQAQSCPKCGYTLRPAPVLKNVYENLRTMDMKKVLKVAIVGTVISLILELFPFHFPYVIGRLLRAVPSTTLLFYFVVLLSKQN